MDLPRYICLTRFFRLDNFPRHEYRCRMSSNFLSYVEIGRGIPVSDGNMRTTVPGIYVTGDVAKIEEASYTETAMMDGGVAGLFKFDKRG